MRVLREALLPQRSAWRTFLLAFAGVAAVLVGLLAMHALNVESHDNAPLVAHHSAAAHPAGDVPFAVGAEDHCPGQCGMEGSMLGACILALTFGILTFAGSAMLSRWSSTALLGTRPQHPAATALGPAPPSLTVLSVSRT